MGDVGGMDACRWDVDADDKSTDLRNEKKLNSANLLQVNHSVREKTEASALSISARIHEQQTNRVPY